MPGAGLSWPMRGKVLPYMPAFQENPPYGMIGRVEETSASFEARSAPRLYPTRGSGGNSPGLLGQRADSQSGRACPLRPDSSDFDLLSYGTGYFSHWKERCRGARELMRKIEGPDRN